LCEQSFCRRKLVKKIAVEVSLEIQQNPLSTDSIHIDSNQRLLLK